MIHLDTSFLIRALARGTGEDRLLRTWVREAQDLGMSVVAWTEFLCGPVDPAVVQLALRVVADRPAFGDEDALLAAKLYNASGRRRGSLLDCMIAATALRAGASLATSNAHDFRRFEPEGLRLLAP
jgi:predicted nucleic acid-binding protein